MHINKFKKVGKNKYKIFLDTTELVLYEDMILKYDLLLKKDLSLDEVDKLIEENRYYDAYNMALSYIEVKLRNRKEIIEYLKRKEFDFKFIDYTLDKLDSLHLLDDKRYTEAYVNDKILLSSDGPFKIRRYLVESGIDDVIVDNYLSSISDDVWMDKLNKIVDKKKSLMKSKSYYMFMNKMKNDLYNLGYDKYMIDEVLSNIEYSSDALSKDFEKATRKFKGDKNKITSSLLRKGYSYDDINGMF